MKIRISSSVVEALTSLKIATKDIIGIAPEYTVGDFKCCLISTVYGQCIVIAHGLALAYPSVESFLEGFEPLAIVKGEDIVFEPGSLGVDIKIIDDTETGAFANDPDFKAVHELMFGARATTEEDASDSAQ